MLQNLYSERSKTRQKELLEKNCPRQVCTNKMLPCVSYAYRRQLRLRIMLGITIVLCIAVYLLLYKSLESMKSKLKPEIETTKKKPFLLLPGDANWSKPWPPFHPPPRSVGPIMNRKVFNTAQRCLVDSPFVNDTISSFPILDSSDYELPDDIEQHYFDMLNYTAPLRQIKVSSYAGYDGPWLENIFISSFCCDKPLSFFGGYVPLFVQWTDLSHTSADKDEFVAWFNKTLSRNFISMLRKDVIYLAVVQHAKGPFLDRKVVHPQNHWNILVLSGGGSGHVPIPLLMKELPFESDLTTKSKENLFAFAGTDRYPVRRKMIKDLQELSLDHRLNFRYNIYHGPEWKEAMRSASLNLAPRGYGRTSFRLVECIQMGLIPVYLWDDHEWAPYRGSPAYVGSFGYSMHINNFKDFVNQTVNGLENDPNYLKIPERTAMMKRIRETHYTMEGLMQQIKYFFRGDPRSDLVCQRHPFEAN